MAHNQFSSGEEEDGDEDEEAEAPTGKRVAEDDEVGRPWLGLGYEVGSGFAVGHQ